MHIVAAAAYVLHAKPSRATQRVKKEPAQSKNKWITDPKVTRFSDMPKNRPSKIKHTIEKAMA